MWVCDQDCIAQQAQDGQLDAISVSKKTIAIDEITKYLLIEMAPMPDYLPNNN